MAQGAVTCECIDFLAVYEDLHARDGDLADGRGRNRRRGTGRGGDRCVPRRIPARETDEQEPPGGGREHDDRGNGEIPARHYLVPPDVDKARYRTIPSASACTSRFWCS